VGGCFGLSYCCSSGSSECGVGDEQTSWHTCGGYVHSYCRRSVSVSPDPASRSLVLASREPVHSTGKSSFHSGSSASIFGFFVFHRTTHHRADPSTPSKFQMFQSPSQLLKESSALVLSRLPAHRFSLIKVGAAPAIHAVASIVGSKLNACS
jgi:hypothetical protein